jgi:hypothetical protein
MSNDNSNGNDIADHSQTRDGLHNPSRNSIPTNNYEPFDFEINQEFIEENKKMNSNLVRHRHNHKQKFAPFTRSQRRKRRTGLQTAFRTWCARNKNSRTDEGRQEHNQ